MFDGAKLRTPHGINSTVFSAMLLHCIGWRIFEMVFFSLRMDFCSLPKNV